MQVKQTLQSIIDNYEVANEADEEVVMEATQHLQSLNAPQPEATAAPDGEDNGDTPTIEIESE